MKVSNMMYFGIILILTIAIIALCIYIILSLWQNQKVQELLSPFFRWISLKEISLKDIIQTTVSILAILIAVFALTKDSVRDSESSKRYSESVSREKNQHKEIMDVYSEQKDLLLKYNQSADSMIEQLRIQAEISKLQFENQKILTQPGVNIGFHIQDTLRTSLNFEDDNWIMPEVIFRMYNFGNRIAKDVTLDVKFVSPKAKKIHHFSKTIDSFIYPKASMDKLYFPIIDVQDKKFFFISIELEWTDEFNGNNKVKQHLITKCIRENSNLYTDGVATGEHIKIVNSILENPAKVVTDSKIIRKYMYDTYNK